VILLLAQISPISKSVLRQLCVHSLRMQADPLWSNSVNTNLPVHESALRLIESMVSDGKLDLETAKQVMPRFQRQNH
jgi:polyhydroxyalkanoate synthesis regulator phasin